MGFLRARILEQVATSSSRGLLGPGIGPLSPASTCTAGGFFTAEPSGQTALNLLLFTIPSQDGGVGGGHNLPALEPA